jgi:hypothetical protein
VARGTIKIRYRLQVTRRIRVQTRVRYSVRVISTVRSLVSQARAGGHTLEDAREELFSSAYALLPSGTDQDELRDAIDAVCQEVGEDE